MAIYAPSESPAVITREIDLTNGVPNVPTSTGAIVGNYRWGPCNEPTLVNNEGTLVASFGSPDDTNTIDFHSASYYLRYSSDLYVIRAGNNSATGTSNSFVAGGGAVASQTIAIAASKYTVSPSAGRSGATFSIAVDDEIYTTTVSSAGSGYAVGDTFTILGARLSGVTGVNDLVLTVASLAGGGVATVTQVGVAVGEPNARTSPSILNNAEFDNLRSGLDSDGHTFVGKFPGLLGNSLKIEICGVGGDSAASVGLELDSDFTNWAYANNFDAAPGTSSHTANIGGVHDECHVVVIDTTGEISGTKGSVVETYPFVSQAKGAQNADGTNNFLTDVINNRSQYVRMIDMPVAMRLKGAGSPAVSGVRIGMSETGKSGVLSATLGGGTAGSALAVADYMTAYNTVDDTAQYLVDFLIAPSLVTATNHVTLVNHLTSIAATKRKDCMVFASPQRAGVVNTPATATATTLSGLKNLTRSSYLAVDNNFLKVYDKYNDKYIFIPASSSTAGLCAATDNNFAPWVSPAGTRRGQYFGVTALAYSPNKSQRDQLYRAGINPVTNLPGNGILLFGDKTHLNRPSAFDRINVRRLFLVIERAIAEAAKNILFEFNDEFTRAEFINIVEPLLRDIKGRRGITDFRLVADETNNTASIIDTNQFVASLFIKPARSINFITLNFVAVRTGVSFEEVVGSAT